MSAWKYVDNAPVYAGATGGDIQRGTAWSRRLVWSDDAGQPIGTPSGMDGYPDVYAIIDNVYYAVDLKDSADDAEEDIVYDVQNQVWCALCTDITDVGSTEIWSTYEYEYVEVPGFTDLAEAQAFAKEKCANVPAEMFASDPMNW